VLAVADPLVVNGDTIEIQAGYTETLAVTLNCNKQLTFIGMGPNPGSQLINTAGLAGDPTIMIEIQEDNITFQNIEFRHEKPSTVNNTIFNSTALHNLTIDTCNLYHTQYAIAGAYKSLQVLNTDYYVAGRGTPTNAPYHNNLSALDGNNVFNNITFDAVGNLMGIPTTYFLYIESTAFTFGSLGDTSLSVYNTTYSTVGTLFCGVWIQGFSMGIGKISIDCRSNDWNTSNNGRSPYVFQPVPSKANLLNDFNDIRFSNNRHNANGQGMLSIQGFLGAGLSLGAINGDWTLCGNFISDNITSPLFSKYHFGAKAPSANKILGIQDAIYVNPYPTNNPYQNYIDCSAGGDFSQYIVRVQATPRHHHKYNRRLF